MSLENKLPYLGDEQQDGSLKISEHLIFKNNLWQRPDYNRFVSKVHQNEIDCLSVLIGIGGIEFCLDECSGLAQTRIMECNKTGKDYLHDSQWFACFEFRNLISDIRELMDLGVESDNLKSFYIQADGALTTGQDNFNFSFDVHYNVKEFLQWAIKNSYTIPKEIIHSVGIQTDGSNKTEETNKVTTVDFPKWTGAPIEKWEDISITLLSHDMVRVQTLHESKRVTFSELGMQDKRKGDEPKKVWETLKIFASANGVYPTDPLHFQDDFSGRTKELNNRLKTFFGITDSIFKHNYKKYKRWETKINFSSKLELFRDTSQEKTFFDEELEDRARSLNIDSPYQVDKP